jgi:hypothetical protein
MGYHVVRCNANTMGESVIAEWKSRIHGRTTDWTNEPQPKTRNERTNTTNGE